MHLECPIKNTFLLVLTVILYIIAKYCPLLIKIIKVTVKVMMNSLTSKNSQTLTSSDIENLALRFGGKSDDYIEIVNKQQNNNTINKYALLKEINNELNT